jgi:hypothetical protein
MAMQLADCGRKNKRVVIRQVKVSELTFLFQRQ